MHICGSRRRVWALLVEKRPKRPWVPFHPHHRVWHPPSLVCPPPSRWLTPPGDDGEKPRAEESCRARTHHARTSIRSRGQVHRICAGARKAKCGCRSACWGRGAWGAGDHAWPCNPCIEPSAGHGRNSNDRHPRAQAACLHTRLWTRRRHSLPRSQMQPRPASDNRRGMINTAQCSAAPRTETSSLGA